jgi:2-polyprenyl-6-hydroxyphenyl methylase/3-demethylubiquinone-9 3-methyltransferase
MAIGTADAPAETFRDLRTIPCKCCGGEATLCAAIDFHRSCEDTKGPVFPPAGVDIPYHRCGSCGFAFTIAFDELTPEQFSTWIYNADYVRVDPDFTGRRAAHSAQLIQNLFGHVARDIRVLDYGGGDGQMAAALRTHGFTDVESWDPFYADTAPPAGTFDLVTAFEVMEHTPTPRETLAAMQGLMASPGLIFFSTLLQPAGLGRLSDWWYAAPRNGHVSLYTRQALASLAASLGLTTGSASDLLHVAFAGQPPAWSRGLFGGH